MPHTRLRPDAYVHRECELNYFRSSFGGVRRSGGGRQPLCSRDGMAAGPITLWAEGERRFTLDEKDGRFELTLHEHDRVVRVERCDSEHQARDRAHGWLIALEVMRDE